MSTQDDSLKGQSERASTATFATALAFNAIVFGAELVAFTLIRPYFKAIYEPRTYVPPKKKRVSTLTKNLILWPISVFKADHNDIIRVNGLDSYFFVRFLRMMVKVFLPIWVVSWAVLLPVTSVNIRGSTKSGLDVFIFGNVGNDQQNRYAAHIILVWFFTFWMFYNIKMEMRHFILTRQKHLISKTHAKAAQAKTLLVTGIPRKYLNQPALHKLFNDLPGGVKKIWINRNLKELPDVYDRRIAAENKLESAETQLMKTAAKLRLADLKKRAKTSKSNGAEATDVEASRESAAYVVPKDQRPQHKTGFLGLFGSKVDSIEWAREEIRVTTQLLEEARRLIEGDGKDRKVVHEETDSEDNETVEEEAEKKEKSYPPLNSAFVMFNKQIAAHLGMQTLLHHEPYRMSGKYVEVSPDDVIWANLNLNPYEQKVRMAISYAATAGLIILWAFPVAFIGVVSNVYQLCATAFWLAWICKLPKVVVGIIAGILPPVLLAVLMMLLPIILRLLARLEGIPKYTGLELSLMTRFFIFQVIHSFLIVTLSSGIMAALPQLISDPTSVPSILAKNLPQASTFFLTYIILQGLAGTAAGFLQIVPLIIYYVKLFILGSTPRAVYGIKYGLGSVAWGTLFPGITLLAVITLAYSIISPIINGLACATFFLFYMLYKYLFLWVYDQPSTRDTGGLFFPKAIQHVFVGLYIQHLCLAALFFLARNGQNKASAVPQGALMIVLIVFTAAFHAVINNSYGPLIHALPLSLADKSYSDAGVAEESKESARLSAAPADTEPKARTSDISETRESKIIEEETKPLASTSKAANANPEDEVEEYGFAHPAISRPPRTVWIPKDALGLAEEEERGCREAGVNASVSNAVMDETGKVDITGGPPDSKED